MSHLAGNDPRDFVLSRVWCLPETPFGCTMYMASWLKLWCGLKPTTGCVGSGSTWEVFRYSSMSDVPCNWPWVTCLELPCYLLFVAAWKGPICVCLEGANLCTKISFLQLRAKNRSIKGPRLPEVHLHLSAAPPPPEVAWSSSKAFRRNGQWAHTQAMISVG